MLITTFTGSTDWFRNIFQRNVFLRETYLTLVVCCVDILVGVAYGFSAQLIPYLESPESDLQLDKNSSWWIAEAGVIFRPVGCLADIVLVDRLGRLTMIQLTMSISAVGWFIVAISWNEFVFCAGRAISSFAIGMITAPPIYVAEMTDSKHRAVFLQVLTVSLFFGIGFIYILNALFYWRIVAGILTLYCVLSFFQIYLIPESAYWYMNKERNEEANNSFKWIYNEDIETVTDRIKTIQETSQINDISFLNNIKNPSVYKPLLILMVAHLFRTGLGYEIFASYAVDMFNQVQKVVDNEDLVIFFGVMNALSAICSCWIVYVVRKRTIILTSIITMIICIGYVYVSESNHIIVMILSFNIYMILAGTICLQLFFGLTAELLPSCSRGATYGFTSFYALTVAFIYSELYGIYADYVPFQFILLFFFLNNVSLLIFTYYFIPETSNKTLQQIEQYFQKEEKNNKIPLMEIKS